MPDEEIIEALTDQLAQARDMVGGEFRRQLDHDHAVIGVDVEQAVLIDRTPGFIGEIIGRFGGGGFGLGGDGRGAGGRGRDFGVGFSCRFAAAGSGREGQGESGRKGQSHDHASRSLRRASTAGGTKSEMRPPREAISLTRREAIAW